MSAEPRPARLVMRGVEKSFGPVRALAGVDLEVRAGEVHALLGENGAGKSTLMKVLSGAHAPDAGSLELDGRPYRPRGPHDAREQGVAMIYQELTLAPHLTVAQNVALGREPARLGLVRDGVQRARVRAALERLGHPELEPDRRVAELGPGPRQLVEIARALAHEARVVVLDEPTSSLGREDTERLFEVVRRLRDDGVAVVHISHFLEEVLELADRFTVLRDGRSVLTGAVEGSSPEQWIEAMVGRSLGDFFPRVPHAPGGPLLELSDLVAPGAAGSLVLRRGEILGIAGLVGAGRSELLRAVHGLAPVRSGSVRVAGRELGSHAPRASLRAGMGLVPEDRKQEGLALGLSIADNLTLSRLAPFGRLGWVSRRAQARRAEALADALALRRDHVGQAVGQLSGGNQQKVALARLLHQEVDVFLLDEPTRGIDVGSKVEIYRLMGEQAAAGRGLLVVSSYLPELLGVCDRIAVMHRGVLGAARPTAEWTAASLLDEATRGARTRA